MGIYCYKTTPGATRVVTVLTTTGKVEVVRVQLYSFAFKLGRWIDNPAKAEARLIVPCYRAFDRKNVRPLPLATSAEVEVGAYVFQNNGVICPHEFGEGLKIYGKIIKTSRMAKVPAGGLQVETDADKISRRYHDEPLSWFVERTHPSYRPSVYCNGDNHNYGPREIAEKTIFADAYDAAQAARGDSRRAYRT
jgi:hypothetical protein